MEATFVGYQKPKFILVVRSQDSNSLIRKITDLCCAGWENYLSVRVYDPKAKDISLFTESLVDDFFEYSVEVVYHQKGTLDLEILEQSSVKNRPCGTVATMVNEISSHLKDLGIHWHAHAMSEWQKSSLKSANPDVWVEQFSKIGHKQVGINLLKSLRVISTDELRQSFRVPLSEEVGLKIAHAYIHEDEAGSSSIAIKNILEHMHPEGAVSAIDLSKADVLDDFDCDVLYVYEDGLWSGVEVVKRLNLISELEGFKNSSFQIVFKYCVTCDAGLAAARIFTLGKPHRRFMFPSAGEGFHFNFLKADTDTRFPLVADRSDVIIRMAIDEAILPYAFAASQIWNGDTSEGVRVCSEMGEQLVKARLDKNNEQIDDHQRRRKIDRLKLGAMGFASTVVFESSIPKPVLPIMWLSGSVSIDEKTVEWRPLFWDARRTGAVEHHY